MSRRWGARTGSDRVPRNYCDSYSICHASNYSTRTTFARGMLGGPALETSEERCRRRPVCACDEPAADLHNHRPYSCSYRRRILYWADIRICRHAVHLYDSDVQSRRRMRCVPTSAEHQRHSELGPVEYMERVMSKQSANSRWLVESSDDVQFDHPRMGVCKSVSIGLL